MSGVAKDADDSDASSTSGSQRTATTQMSPLDLRFSQKKMRNVFADSRLIEDAVGLVQAVRRSPEEAELYDAPWRLETPFPPIEVLRWRCKLRDDATGRPQTDTETGAELFDSEENWFTLDNRRLYCLQRAALQLLPERCTADVIAEVRKDRRLREIKKFRTLDSGKSIWVGSRVDGVPFTRWSWRSELASPSSIVGVGGEVRWGGPVGKSGDSFGQFSSGKNGGYARGNRGRPEETGWKSSWKGNGKSCGNSKGSKDSRPGHVANDDTNDSPSVGPGGGARGRGGKQDGWRYCQTSEGLGKSNGGRGLGDQLARTAECGSGHKAADQANRSGHRLDAGGRGDGASCRGGKSHGRGGRRRRAGEEPPPGDA